LLRQHLRKRKVVFENFHGVFYLLVLLTSGDALLLNEMSNALQAVSLENNPDRPAFVAMHALLLLQQGCEAEARQLIQNWRAVTRRTPLCHLCLELAEFYINREESNTNISQLQTKVRLFTPVLPMMAHIFTAIIHRHRGETPPASPWRDFTTLIAQQENWQRTFQALQAWMQTNKVRETTSSSTHSKRLAWFINTRQGFIEDVVEQSFRVRQGWSDGRPVAFKRLHEQDPRLDYLTEQDRRALRTLRKDGMGWHDSYIFDTKETLQLLVGHPALFDSNNRRSPIELFSYPLELVITSTRRGFRLALSHQADAPTTFLQEESPGRFRVIHFSEKHLLLHRILPNKGLEIPEQAKQDLVNLIHQQGLPLSMRVEVPGLDETAQEGNTTPVLQLRPLEQGLKCTLQVRPFGPQGPGYFPGQGNRSVLANLPEGQQRANRNLSAEKKAVEQVLTAVPLLGEIFTEGFTAPLEGLELCLEMLLQVRENPHPLVVEWPEGKPLRVYPPLDPNQISLSVKQGRDWFQVEGTAAVDPKEVVTMSRLLANLPHASGRFIPLDDGRFVALTNQLKQQLEQLQAISEASKEGNRVPQLAGFVLDNLVANCGQVQADAGWQSLQQRIRQANEHQPQLPSTLQAELRDYQLEGFQWLSRLARWGAGACLADDMGLGKTIQAIAILLEQGTLGPSLVVAPTSVCHNWQRELARFAPALQVYHLAESSDRSALLASLTPMTVVIASYGLLHNEEEALTAMDWQVMILDEAQAIKNADTRRAQASRKLKAAFRIALSGTPIENYLDELWSLFQFINPNLLGSRESFQRRFATPIEKHKDHKAMQALRTLVRPFILRRTKSMVLSELPPRTDVTLEVELPANERAFQEALRQKILSSLENLPTDNPQERRFRILAEITRLRRACCHPALIDPATPLPGAKLTLFMELVEELIRNRHKALVFSQFVTLLELVEKALRHTGIRYQYLDGSTPAKEREKRVAAFQAGEGELFLISLKAGGLGLNLTAADYVIHLDPWWNPAVEDQASDRAHRIGQQRPVTVYRMIVQGSIEEKMVKLHQEKRDLADALLEGSDAATRLSEDDLMAMLRGI
ncbi:MAG: DEAD/DEAH box helicase, partial [Magnetococcales bacterium]|nr:DEAD/DEAH box helicase [Magnetococcales bacterium]